MSARRTKFYLDKRQGKLMGVCAGIANYTGFDVFWVRIGFVALVLMAGWPLIIYIAAGLIASDQPRGMYESQDEAKFWQGVRSNPGRSTRDIRGKFRDIDRRLADIETHYTSHNARLANEIDNLR